MATGTIEVKLNKEQKAAVEHTGGPLLIVAGAGTGKTTVVTQRILWLLNPPKESKLQPVKPDEILAMTFTEKAAEEMVDRIDQLLPYGYVDLWVTTFHGFCERILKQHGLDIGLPNDFHLLNQTDAWFLVRKNLEKFDLDYYRPLGNPTKFIHALLQHFSRCKDEAVGPEEYLTYAKTLELNEDSPDQAPKKRKTKPHAEVELPLEGSTSGDSKRMSEIANAYHVYQQLLLEHNALDFGDLLLYTLKLFRERPNILKKYQEQFKHVLIDEFQDTNWVQYELVRLLAAPRNNLTVVADDDQAIYQWRGASVSNVLRFKDDYPKSEQVVLVENYRSSQNILDTAYSFIQKNNPYRLEYQLSDVADIVAHAKERGVALKSFKPIQKRLKAMVPGEGTIEHIHAATQEEEARRVAEKIRSLRQAQARTLSWNDFAILVRANSQANVFMHALDAADIPYQFLASSGLYAKPVVLDLLAYLRLLDNYHESAAVYRVLLWHVFGISSDDCATILHVARRKSWSLYEVLKQLPTIGGIGAETRHGVTTLLGLVSRHQQLARERSVGQVVLAVLEDTGYLKALTRASETDRTALDRLNAIRQFYKKIESFERSAAEPSVQRFLEYTDLALESGDEGSLEQDTEAGPETVKILTVHGAKGLEFKHVFIVNLVELRFPSTDRKDPIELPDALVKEIAPETDMHLQEERRLFYVAMTRARQGLYFTSADDYGGTRKKRLSRFLDEVGITKENKELSNVVTKQLPSYSMTNVVDQQLPSTVVLPEKFSFTQLKAFETCPYQYRFAHILKIPIRGKGTFSFGRTMHLTLQKFFQRVIDSSKQTQGTLFTSPQPSPRGEGAGEVAPSLDDLLTMYDECWIDDWYESKQQKEEYRKKGRDILKEFYAKHEGGWPTPKALEKSFMVKIGDVVLKGTIDRIDPIEGGVAIVDYKTGKPKEKLDWDAKEQLLIYQIAASEVLHEKPKKLAYWYLNENTEVPFLGTEEEIARMKQKIVDTVQAMRVSQFAATPSPMKCKNCDFKEICEYRQL